MANVKTCNAHFHNLMNAYDKIEIFRDSQKTKIFLNALAEAFANTNWFLQNYAELLTPGQMVAIRTFYKVYSQEPLLDAKTKNIIGEIFEKMKKQP